MPRPPLERALARLARGARRLRLVLGVAVAISAVVVIAAVYPGDRASAPDSGSTGTIVRIGVEPGGSIPGYVRRSHDALRAAIADVPGSGHSPLMFALVSLSRYLAPGQLPEILEGVRVTNVFLRVPLHDRQTEIVKIPAYRMPADVIGGMRNEAQVKEIEAAGEEALLAKITGTSGEDRTSRATYRSNAEVAHAEAAAYRSLCACVYAAVVYATPAALGTLAGRAWIRAVDPALGLQVPDRAVFLPPLPEQHDRAVPPEDSGTG